MSRGLLAPLLLLLVLLPAGIRAQEAEKPEELLRRADSLAAGDAADGVALYRQWLRDNPESDSFAQVLQRAVAACREASEALRLLAEFSPRLRDPAAREASLERQWALLRLSGRVEEALIAQIALPETPARLVERAGLCLELGLTGEAEQLLGRALERGDTETSAAARLLLARVYLATERGAQGERELRALVESRALTRAVPAALLALGEALRQRGDGQEAAEVLAELQARFPASPEALLAGGKGARYPSQPLRLLPNEPPAASLPEAALSAAPAAAAPRKVQVQAGSFRDPENARYLVRDLEDRGFEARLTEKTVGEARYYRVVVGQELNAQSAQTLILRLKDAGFEGFLLLE
jgi:cell division septation protein DedD